MSAPAKYQPYNPANSARTPTPVSQATAIEQSRAIAEVQAAVVVAQSCPRDMRDAEAEMEYVCGRLDMAEQAFYQVTNRGTGASVHLMRELARIWGNIDYGVKELHRSDDVGESEVQAFSWDVQRNTRSSRTFIVPHQRMKQGKRVDLTDLTDIYLNNQNVGARAVRECIATILPRWFTEKAQNLCRNTLENGEGEPLQDRIAAMVSWFEQKFGITEKQIEARLDKKRGQWDAGDVAQMKIAGGSIARGEALKDELFPPLAAELSSTASEIAAPAPKSDEAQKSEETPAQKSTPRVSAARKKLNGRMFTLLSTAGVGDDKHRDDRLIVLSKLVDRTVESSNDLTDDEVANVIETLEALIDQDTGDAAALDDWVTSVLNAHDAAQDNTEPAPAETATEPVQEEPK